MTKKKLPFDLFYYGDFYNDLHEHPAEIVGGWMLLLCKLWSEPERGVADRNLKFFSQILKKNSRKTLKILQYLKENNIATIDTNLNNNVEFWKIPDNKIRVVCRRMVKREKFMEADRLRKKNDYSKDKKKELNEPDFSGFSPTILHTHEPVDNSHFLQKTSDLYTISYKKPKYKSADTKVDNLLITSSQDPTQPKEKAASLNQPKPEETITHQDDDYAEKIDGLREKLGKVYWKDGRSNVHAWVMWQVKRKVKGKAILYCLMRVDEARPQNPWAYCEGILKKYHDGELHKKDNIFQDIVDKLKKI